MKTIKIGVTNTEPPAKIEVTYNKAHLLNSILELFLNFDYVLEDADMVAIGDFEIEVVGSEEE